MTSLRSALGTWATLCLGAVVGWVACKCLNPADGAPGDQVDPAQASSIDIGSVTVTIVDATVGDLPVTVSTTGVVQADPAAEHTLTSRASGRVARIDVAKGQWVAEGAELLEFEAGALIAQVATAKSALQQAQNQLTEYDGYGQSNRTADLESAVSRSASQRLLADSQVARLEPLTRDGLVAEKALAEARDASERARADQRIADLALAAFQSTGSKMHRAALVAQLEAAQAVTSEAELALAERIVRAPCAGQILEVIVRPGAQFDSGAVLGRMITSDPSLLVDCQLPAGVARSVSAGARAVFQDRGNGELVGRVTQVLGTIDPALGLVEVIVGLAPSSPRGTPGSAVFGQIELRRLHQSVLVPEAAIVRSSDREVVLLAVDSRARSVAVEVLGRHGGLVAVAGEVRAGDHVIVAGAYNLPDGARVLERSR